MPWDCVPAVRMTEPCSRLTLTAPPEPLTAVRQSVGDRVAHGLMGAAVAAATADRLQEQGRCRVAGGQDLRARPHPDLDRTAIASGTARAAQPERIFMAARSRRHGGEPAAAADALGQDADRAEAARGDCAVLNDPHGAAIARHGSGAAERQAAGLGRDGGRILRRCDLYDVERCEQRIRQRLGIALRVILGATLGVAPEPSLVVPSSAASSPAGAAKLPPPPPML